MSLSLASFECFQTSQSFCKIKNESDLSAGTPLIVDLTDMVFRLYPADVQQVTSINPLPARAVRGRRADLDTAARVYDPTITFNPSKKTMSFTYRYPQSAEGQITKKIIITEAKKYRELVPDADNKSKLTLDGFTLEFRESEEAKSWAAAVRLLADGIAAGVRRWPEETSFERGEEEACTAMHRFVRDLGWGVPVDPGTLGGKPEADTTALLDELGSLKVTALLKRARAIGINQDSLDEIQDADKPKDALIALLVQAAEEGSPVEKQQEKPLAETEESLDVLQRLEALEASRGRGRAQAESLEATAFSEGEYGYEPGGWQERADPSYSGKQASLLPALEEPRAAAAASGRWTQPARSARSARRGGGRLTPRRKRSHRSHRKDRRSKARRR